MPKKLPKHVDDVSDARHLMMLRKLLHDLIEYPDNLSDTFVAGKQWAVCPVVDRPDEADAERLCAAAAGLNDATKCYVVPVERMSFTEVYEAQLRKEAIAEILCFEHLSLMNVVVVPESRSFVLLKESADYFLVAGPRQFVEQAIGKTLAAARQDFDRAATVVAGDSRYVQLQPIADRYRRFDGIQA